MDIDSTLDRRSFLGLAAATCLAGQATARPRPDASPCGKWERIRHEFLLSSDRIHMAGFLIASHPRAVRASIAAYRDAIERDPARTIGGNWKKKEAAVFEAAARFLGAGEAEIALTGSTTEGLAVVYTGLVLSPGDEILSTTHDHYSTNTALDLQAARSGAVVRRIALYEKSAEADAGEILRRIESAILPATRVLALTWVHSGTGVKLPVARIGAAIARVNAGRRACDRVLLCIDGAHALGIENFQVRELGCDFLAAGCHKWLCGPRGTGLVWGHEAAWARTRPIVPSFAAFAGRTPGRLASPGGFHAFEHRWALPEAFTFQEKIGRDAITSRLHGLATRLKRKLAEVPGLTLHTPLSSELSSGMICFEMKGLTPDEIVARLDRAGITASTTPYTPSYARLAPGLHSTDQEVDRAADAVLRIA